MTREFDRRSFIQSAAVAIAGAALPHTASAGGQGLADLAAEKGILCGSWVRGTSLQKDDVYQQIVNREFKLLVSSLEMMWDVVEPRQGAENFGKADAVRAWAEAHQKKLRGCSLLWYKHVPGWVDALRDRAATEKAIISHITSQARHYAGAIESWDVVNEPFMSSHGRADGLRDYPLLRVVGPEYLDIAFHAARKADPRALLVLNDYGFEYEISNHWRKRADFLKLLDGFKKRGTPIDALGIHSHLRLDYRRYFDGQKFAAFLKEVSDRGLQIMITELDVADRGAPSDISARDKEVAAAYREFLDAALANPATKTVITWGFTDGDSWVVRGDHAYFRRTDGLKPRPLPFDADYKPKPAYLAMADAFKAAAPR